MPTCPIIHISLHVNTHMNMYVHHAFGVCAPLPRFDTQTQYTYTYRMA